MNKKHTLIIIIVLLLATVFSFGLTAAIVFGICWAFGLRYTLKAAFGVWLISVLVSGTIGWRNNK